MIITRICSTGCIERLVSHIDLFELVVLRLQIAEFRLAEIEVSDPIVSTIQMNQLRTMSQIELGNRIVGTRQGLQLGTSRHIERRQRIVSAIEHRQLLVLAQIELLDLRISIGSQLFQFRIVRHIQCIQTKPIQITADTIQHLQFRILAQIECLDRGQIPISMATISHIQHPQLRILRHIQLRQIQIIHIQLFEFGVVRHIDLRNAQIIITPSSVHATLQHDQFRIMGHIEFRQTVPPTIQHLQIGQHGYVERQNSVAAAIEFPQLRIVRHIERVQSIETAGQQLQIREVFDSLKRSDILSVDIDLRHQFGLGALQYTVVVLVKLKHKCGKTVVFERQLLIGIRFRSYDHHAGRTNGCIARQHNRNDTLASRQRPYGSIRSNTCNLLLGTAPRQLYRPCGILG